MLSSIHPLGERARSNRWWLTVSAFTAGSVMAGAVLGATSAMIGSLLWDGQPSPVWVMGTLVAAGAADLLRVPVPWLHRQVNERWIGTYRGWVYGLGFGIQLGIGLSTYVVTWAVPALIVTLALAAEPGLGVVAGALFGLGRAIPLLAAGWIDRPSRLGSFHRTMATVGPRAHIVAALGLLGIASALVVAA